MNLHDIGYPLTCLLVPSAGQSFHLFCAISQYLIDWLAQNLAQKFMVLRSFPKPLMIPWCFLLCHHKVDHCGFVWNISTAIGWIGVKFGSEIHAPLGKNCNHFGDPLTSHLVPAWGQKFSLSDTLVHVHIHANHVKSNRPQLNLVFSAN